VRPPPQPTEEATASLEDLIKARIAEHNFDDVPRVAPAAPEVHRKTLELDDKRSGKVRCLPTALPCTTLMHRRASMRAEQNVVAASKQRAGLWM
jgi:U3 small nucleolar ribonucleoprotein component